MEKQTFKIPEGCTEISVEQDGNKLIATFGKKFEPKEGDVCAMNIGRSIHPLIFFYTHKRGNNVAVGLDVFGQYCNDRLEMHDDADMRTLRPATPEESKKLFDALEKEGLQWDSENKKVVKMRWKPKDYCGYYSFNYKLMVKNPIWHNDDTDNLLYLIGNCFETEEKCLSAIENVKELLLK